MKCKRCGHDDKGELVDVEGVGLMHIGCAIDYLVEQLSSLRSYVEMLRGQLHLRLGEKL
jgi:hypothetical protein